MKFPSPGKGETDALRMDEGVQLPTIPGTKKSRIA
jgi:hypothetical protein